MANFLSLNKVIPQSALFWFLKTPVPVKWLLQQIQERQPGYSFLPQRLRYWFPRTDGQAESRPTSGREPMESFLCIIDNV